MSSSLLGVLCPDAEVHDGQGFEYYFYETADIEMEDKAMEGILKFYHTLNEEWRRIRANSLFTKPANYIRANSFRAYLKVCKATERGVFTADKDFYLDFFMCLGNNHFTENANKIEPEIPKNKVDPCIIPLFIHWIKQKTAPVKVIDEMYSKLNLQAAEHTSLKKYYVPLKEAICENYKLNADQSQDEVKEKVTDEEIREWMRNFNSIVCDFSKGLKAENDEEWQQRVNESLDHMVWKKMYLMKKFIKSISDKIYFNESPLCMLKSVKAQYEQGISEASNSLNYVNNILELMDRNIAERAWLDLRFADIKPVKEISIEALSHKDIGKIVLDSLREYSRLQGPSTEISEKDIDILTEINGKKEDTEVIKSYIDKAELSGIRNSYIVLNGKIERRIFEIGMFGECIIDPMYVSYLKKNAEDLNKKLARNSVSAYTIGYMIYTKQYHCPQPIAIGTDGKIYTMISQIIVRGFDTIIQLLEKVAKTEALNVFDRIEIYDAKLGYAVEHRNFVLEK